MQQLNDANRNPGGNPGSGPLTNSFLPLDIQTLIPAGGDENGGSGQTPGDGEESEDPESSSQGNPGNGDSDDDPGEDGGNQ